jgi:membrane protein
MQMAAALSYYFVLSLFPALIFLSAVVAYLPVPDLFNQALALMARFLPADSMGLVRRVLADVVSPNKGTFLSFGIQDKSTKVPALQMACGGIGGG